MKQFTGFHKHAKAYEIKKKLDIFDSYYKFTFVRNPFDFLVSLYFYILQAKYHRHHDVVNNMNFLEFLKWYIANNPPHQIDFVTDPYSGKRLVDYIGRFETLEKNLATIQERLGLKMAISVEHKNRSFKRKRKDYNFFYDEESVSLVGKYFQTDLNMLGYDFDGFVKNMPIMRKGQSRRHPGE
ncbi:sulfotransferase family 2 domain-containing protein [Desulfococcaceae bacterium HSG7]|nr:sulfotransferase family 2 domain-containing protein [Desulfococcaceae bacterium HSG7]